MRTHSFVAHKIEKSLPSIQVGVMFIPFDTRLWHHIQRAEKDTGEERFCTQVCTCQHFLAYDFSGSCSVCVTV